MGNGNSLPVVEGFSRDEIAKLEKRFLKLDLDQSGTISVGEFLSIPELKENPLVKRVVDVMDADLSGEVDFKEFVYSLAQFAVRCEDTEKKLKFLFSIYDMDRDGFISNGELFQVLKMMVGKNLNSTQLQQIVDRTILYLDKDEDGRISFEEFRFLVKRSTSLSSVTNTMALDI